jgi:ATP-dependent exoDNAse (exonuclease V) alpha subunit
MIALLLLALNLLAALFKSKSGLEAENAALRQQLIVLRRKVKGRIQLNRSDRLFFVQLCVRFDGRMVTYGFGELDTLVPAYPATIHKTQGSEYAAAVIPVMTQHYTMLQRNLLYTGVTRGKRLDVLVGQKKAVAIAVRNVSERRRWSRLKEWLSPL